MELKHAETSHLRDLPIPWAHRILLSSVFLGDFLWPESRTVIAGLKINENRVHEFPFPDAQWGVLPIYLQNWGPVLGGQNYVGK